ncbi:hypothetical protein [Nitrosopumilus sp.]|uniref:hypothetical protein n=1 Tax=Nitrosopumilus sp. TaxID=2024843 RepID=UPI003D0FCE5D
MVRSPEYCSVGNIADWFRIDINANTDPNTTMVEEFIMDNEDKIDRETGHSWLTKKVYTAEVHNVSDIYDYGHGMYIPLKHRQLKPWDESEGDLFEIWNGIEWTPQTVTGNNLVHFEESKGLLYIRGFIYTILRKNRFRVTYRYGGTKEVVDGQPIPRDIKKCCKLMTCIDMLTTDFKMSEISYGGMGNVAKKDIIEIWQKEIDKIIWNYSEIQVVM